MKLVLLKPYRKLGNIGDIIEVKDGFGRNYLIPANIAVRATKENIASFESRKADLESKNKDILANAQKVAKEVEGKDFTFISQSSDDGRLFGSVNAKDIAKIVSKNHPSVTHNNIVIDTPIKYTGVHEVFVHLHPEVDAKILINVSRTETEAQDALKAHKDSGDSESSNDEKAA